MAYNNGREDRKWRIWKEAEEKVLREHGVDEATIEQIRIDDRADFNSNRRFYHWTSDFGEYLEGINPSSFPIACTRVSRTFINFFFEHFLFCLFTYF